MTQRSKKTFVRLLGMGVVAAVFCILSPVRAEDPLATARQLLLAGKHAEAEEAFAALPADRAVASALGAARCQQATGRRGDAAKTLDASLAQNKDSADLLAASARLAFERGDRAQAAQLVARSLSSDPQHPQSHLLRAEIDRAAGDLTEAESGFKRLVDYYNERDERDPDRLLAIGVGAAELARWRRLSDQFSFLVNEFYPDLLAIDGEYWPAHYQMGLLFLEKYNEAEANKSFKAALTLNPNASEVHAALARLAIQNYDLAAAQRSIGRALELNPESIDALVCRADVHLANFDAQQAIEVLEQARRLDPLRESTLGRLAAAFAVVDGWANDAANTRYGQLRGGALARNPHAGEFFLAAGEAFDTTRRYPAAARCYREAIEHMPQLLRPQGALGLMAMRLGDEAEARRWLDDSFASDPFNVRVKNSLEVLDVLDGYAVIETDHFVLKFDRAQDEMLARYAARYLEEEVYPELCTRFGFEPAGKSLFEIFNRARNTGGHGWFSARMVGLPYIGTVGACAGKMVAMASPNDMPKKFNWARVLKHEFVHVLNLQQSEFNIPHWYTEALAVGAEGGARPQVWSELLAERVPKGELLNLDTINLGFVRPGSNLDWQMAYCQADQYAQYLVKTYGDGALAKLLEAYRKNRTTREALQECFGVDQGAFEAGYLAHLQEIAAGLAPTEQAPRMSFAELVRAQGDSPDDPELAGRLAEAHLSRKDYPAARRLVDQIRGRHPQDQRAAYVRARLHLVVGENSEALEALAGALDCEAPYGPLLSLLAGLRLSARQFDDAAQLYELGARREPYDLQWTKNLARVFLTSGDNRRLAEALARLADHDPDDLTVRKKLAQLAATVKDWDSAARWAQESLYIDVFDIDSHTTLADAAEAQGDWPTALFERQALVDLDGDHPAWRLGLARAAIELGDVERARREVDAVLQDNPQHAEAKTLLESLPQ